MFFLVFLPKVLVEELERRDKILDVGVSELLFSLVVGGSNPEGSAKYLSGAFELLEQAKREVEGGDLRQASEKVWGSCALAIKDYALAKEGRKLESHGELWVYKNYVVTELGEWVKTVLRQADFMHKNFYENQATKEDVEDVLKDVGQFVKKVAEKTSKTYEKTSQNSSGELHKSLQPFKQKSEANTSKIQPFL